MVVPGWWSLNRGARVVVPKEVPGWWSLNRGARVVLPKPRYQGGVP